MDREQIIRMAREAECEETWGADAFRFGEVELERFAALIAVAERDACAKVALAADDQGSVNQNLMQKRIAAAIRARGNT